MKTKAFYNEHIKSLQARVEALVHYQSKALDEYKTKQALVIQKEIDATKQQIQKAQIQSNFAPLE